MQCVDTRPSPLRHLEAACTSRRTPRKVALLVTTVSQAAAHGHPSSAGQHAQRPEATYRHDAPCPAVLPQLVLRRLLSCAPRSRECSRPDGPHLDDLGPPCRR
eukprot:8565405-Heterocapsa_arctica.AAC.1